MLVLIYEGKGRKLSKERKQLLAIVGNDEKCLWFKNVSLEVRALFLWGSELCNYPG